MKEKMNPEGNEDYYMTSQSDVRALVRGELKQLISTLQFAKMTPTDIETKYHYDDCIERINLILKPIK